MQHSTVPRRGAGKEKATGQPLSYSYKRRIVASRSYNSGS